MWSWILFFFFLFVVMFVYFHWVDSKGGSRILNIARWITRSGRHYQQVGTGFCTGTGLDEMAPTHIFFIPFFHTFFSSFSAGLSFWRWGRLALPHFVCLDKKNRRRRNRLPLGLLPLRWKREREREKKWEKPVVGRQFFFPRWMPRWTLSGRFFCAFPFFLIYFTSHSFTTGVCYARNYTVVRWFLRSVIGTSRYNRFDEVRLGLTWLDSVIQRFFWTL